MMPFLPDLAADEDLRHVVARHFGDVGTAPHLHGHQSFHRQHLEGFAQRRAADAEFGGQLHLVDPAAGFQLARIDLLAQPLGHVLVQGAGGQRALGFDGGHGVVGGGACQLDVNILNS